MMIRIKAVQQQQQYTSTKRSYSATKKVRVRRYSCVLVPWAVCTRSLKRAVVARRR